MSKARVFTGRMIVTMGDDFHEVELYSEGKKLKKDLGYIKGDFIYIYRGKIGKKNKDDLKPGIYSKDGKNIFIKPTSDADKEMYSVDNVIDTDVNKMMDEVSKNEDSFIDADEIKIINNNRRIWLPTIEEDDDFLKYAIKRALQEKKVNLKNYRGKFTNLYLLSNMKGGLEKQTTMSVKYFSYWCQALGLKWKMVIEDDGSDPMNPVKNPIEFSSDDF